MFSYPFWIFTRFTKLLFTTKAIREKIRIKLNYNVATGINWLKAKISNLLAKSATTKKPTHEIHDIDFDIP